MNRVKRSKVRLILQHHANRCRSNIEERFNSILVTRAISGQLQTGGTIRLAVRAIEEVLSGALSSAFDEIAPVSKDPDALAMISDFLQSQSGFVDGKLEGLSASVRLKAIAVGQTDDILTGSRQLFEQARERLERQIELQRSAFSAGPALANSPQNRGGRPLAAHWDGMWAAIGNMLYWGDLKPKLQADIERAMKDWLIAHDVNPGDTKVREKARILWSRIQETE